MEVLLYLSRSILCKQKENILILSKNFDIPQHRAQTVLSILQDKEEKVICHTANNVELILFTNKNLKSVVCIHKHLKSKNVHHTWISK